MAVEEADAVEFVAGEGCSVRYEGARRALVLYFDSGFGWERVAVAKRLFYDGRTGSVLDQDGHGGVLPRGDRRRLLRELQDLARGADVSFTAAAGDMAPPSSWGTRTRTSSSVYGVSGRRRRHQGTAAAHSTGSTKLLLADSSRGSSDVVPHLGKVADFEDAAAAVMLSAIGRHDAEERRMRAAEKEAGQGVLRMCRRVAQLACVAHAAEGAQAEAARQQLLTCSEILYRMIRQSSTGREVVR
eukprot:TRINITY_DN22436_c0_g1_i1.p2 TRINITY_DN22436_c0_g1~~TRINITY_DN22436_c0_g1_i1.p2  ORF type:complete len:256 (+),score=81.88 TRINITY_DN22436_c0_g1_i1:42-770(+)